MEQPRDQARRELLSRFLLLPAAVALLVGGGSAWYALAEHKPLHAVLALFVMLLAGALIGAQQRLRARERALSEALAAQRQAVESSKALNAELERRVAERTQILARTNDDLFTMLRELQQTREKLLLADRMVAVGQLAAGVAHEINNPLAYVLSNLHYAERELRARPELPPALLEALGEARQGSERVRDIVRGLKTFSRVEEERSEPVDVQRALNAALNMASNEIRHRAALQKELGPVPRVLGNEGRLSQVLLNLLINAAQAIPEGQAATNTVRVATRTDDAGRAVVEVSDTGAGIPEEIRSRIFDPFFTTKPVGVGTGLGLSVCHGIVSALGGEIQVESQVGRGSTFRLVLPPAEDAENTPPPMPLEPLPEPKRRGRVLVVDDEPLIGAAVRRALSPRHEVVTHTSAARALEELGKGQPFDLILCDLMMPEMDGMEFHAVLGQRGLLAHAQLAFLTGGAFTPEAREFLDRTPAPVVHKPVDLNALERLIAEALERQTPAAQARRDSVA